MGIRKHKSRREEFVVPPMPFAAPITALIGGAGSEAIMAYDAAEDGIQRIRVDTDRVEVRRRMAGIETVVSLPTESFTGITLKCAPNGRFEICLVHIDPSMALSLFSAHDDRDVIAIWRRYARTLRLPLLVEDNEGRLQPVSEETIRLPFDRRGASPLKGRRPRFLSRRRVGKPVIAATLPDWRHASGQWFFSEA